MWVAHFIPKNWKACLLKRFTNDVSVYLCFGIPSFNTFYWWVARKRLKNEVNIFTFVCLVHSFLINFTGRKPLICNDFRYFMYISYFRYSRYICANPFSLLSHLSVSLSWFVIFGIIVFGIFATFVKPLSLFSFVDLLYLPVSLPWFVILFISPHTDSSGY